MKPELLSTKINRICKALNNRKFTNTRIARLCGYSAQSVMYWCNGSKRVPLSAVEAIARKIGSTAEIILADTLQVTGKKALTNYSDICYWKITELKEYPGLTLEEVKTVLEWREKNPDWEP